MTHIPLRGDVKITPEAFHALTARTYAFADALRTTAIDLARGQKGPAAPLITSDVVQRAVLLAGQRVQSLRHRVEGDSNDGQEQVA